MALWGRLILLILDVDLKLVLWFYDTIDNSQSILYVSIQELSRIFSFSHL